MLKKRLDWDNQRDIAQLVNSLSEENVSVCTTDTIFGLLSIISKRSFDKLNDIKGRSQKPYLILVPTPEKMFQLANVEGEKVMNLAKQYWPGPLTLIVKAKESVPAFMQSKEATVALRVPNHKGLLAVMKEVGPLFSTSANVTSEPVPKTIDKINELILQKIDFIVTDGKYEQSDIPSTILDCTDPHNIVLIREGAYSVKELERFYGKPFLKTLNKN